MTYLRASRETYLTAATGEIWPFCGAIALRQSRRQALIFLAVLLYGASRDQVLQFFIGAQPQHFLAPACGVASAEVFVDDVEELLKLERRTTREDRDEFLGHKIRNPAGKCVFLKYSHRTCNLTQIGQNALQFCGLRVETGLFFP